MLHRLRLSFSIRQLTLLAGFAFLVPLLAGAQSKDTLLLKFKGRWDNDKLPIMGSQTFNSLWGWTAPDKREYAIMGSLDSIFFLEVTPSGKPVLRDAEAARFYRCTNREFKTYQHYCYAIGDQGTSSLQIFDLQYLPDSVHKVYDSTVVCYRAHNLFVDHDRLYLADNKIMVPDSPLAHFEYYPMTVLSLANPEVPVLLGNLEPPKINGDAIHAEVHDVYVRHDTAWCSAGNSGLFVYDYRDPSKPELLTAIQPPYPYSGYNHSSALSPDGKTLVFADENHFKQVKVYDASDIRLPIPTLEYTTVIGFKSDLGSVPHNPFIKDTLLYISWYHEGVVVFSISDPSHPRLIGHYDTYPQNDTVSEIGRRYDGYQGCWNVYPFFESGNIIASDMTNGLFVMRFEKEELPDEPWKIKLLGNPVKDKIRLQVATEKTHNVQAALWDMTGRLIWSSSQTVEAGVHTLDYSIGKDLGNAMYLLQVQSEEGVETFRVLSL
jgi:choice-of-anchor B domain-containing protein